MTGQEMWDMGLHEKGIADTYHYIMRVPGGWIYTPCNESGEELLDSIFVPLSNEFLDGAMT